jgi:tetratricopeptide (TPR) repeat protein
MPAADLTPTEVPVATRMADIKALLEAAPVDTALVAARCCELAERATGDAPVQTWLSHAWQRLGCFEAMAQAAGRAAALAVTDFDTQRRLVECHVYSGRIDLARAHLQALEHAADRDARRLLQIAELHVHVEGHAQAWRCCTRALALQPDDPQALYAAASSALSLGRLDEAEALFGRVIALDPDDGDAYVNRSSLRTWSAGTHHVDELTAALRRLPGGHPSAVALHHALAKELEDLGEADRSFGHLQQGAGLRRAQMAYRVEQDVAAMQAIAETFDAPTLARQAPAVAEECAMFVLGLPRSGTTLVDRILSSHSQVASLGEVNTFAFSLMRLAGPGGDKSALVRRSAAVDFSRLGALYRSGVRSYGLGMPRLIDKTPANFLYLGLIHLALPGAVVVHLRRHPLDSCYAMYKTLFRMGYPYSYSLADLGAYYVAYHRLMAHWRSLIPQAFIDLDYEALVDEQAPQTRRLLQHAGLPWEDACLRPQDNASASATASAAQVRRPLYRSSVARWRAYEKQLAPLAEILTRHGIACD